MLTCPGVVADFAISYFATKQRRNSEETASKFAVLPFAVPFSPQDFGGEL
jgi:hypothetical protein